MASNPRRYKKFQKSQFLNEFFSDSELRSGTIQNYKYALQRLNNNKVITSFDFLKNTNDVMIVIDSSPQKSQRLICSSLMYILDVIDLDNDMNKAKTIYINKYYGDRSYRNLQHSFGF